MNEAIVDKVKDLLDGMGDSSATIAAFLEGQGVKGIRRIEDKCPVANYLGKATSEAVGVSGGYASVYIGHYWKHIALPDAVMRFVMAFDNGCFPQLEWGGRE